MKCCWRMRYAFEVYTEIMQTNSKTSTTVFTLGLNVTVTVDTPAPNPNGVGFICSHCFGTGPARTWTSRLLTRPAGYVSLLLILLAGKLFV